jgi:hypothetical protein
VCFGLKQEQYFIQQEAKESLVPALTYLEHWGNNLMRSGRRLARSVRPMGEKMLKRVSAIPLCLAVCLGLAPQCAASDLKVKTLAKACGSENAALHQMCTTYFVGAMDAFEASADLYAAEIPFCYPEGGLSPEDMSLVFRLWASTNPAEQDRAAISGIIISMIERFPCKK